MTLSKSKFYQKGFSLVELLIVVTVIVILAAIITVSARQVIPVARKLESRADINRIVEGMNAFQRDNNGVFPDVMSGTSNLNVSQNDSVLVLDGSNDAERLLNALLAKDSALNPKQQLYIQGAEIGVSGEKGISGGSYLDNWRNPYVVIWDTEYNDKVDDPFDSTASAISRQVIAIGQGNSDEPLSTEMSPQAQGKTINTWE